MQRENLSFADGGRVLLVQFGEDVKIQVDIPETEESMQAEPIELVCSYFAGNGILHVYEVVPIA